MTPVGFPPNRTQATLAFLLGQLRDRADIARTEAVTGRSADAAAALGGRVAEPLGIARNLAAIREHRDAIALAEARARTSQGVLDTLRGLTDALANQTELAIQNRATGAAATVAFEAGAFLEAAVGALNTGIGGRSLLAGDAGDARPIAGAEAILVEIRAIIDGATDPQAAFDALAAAFDAPGGVFETTLYAGGSGNAPRVEIAEGERIDHAARADEAPFRDILRTFGLLASAFDPTLAIDDATRIGLAERAVAALRNIPDPLNRIAARIGAAEARMETVKAGHVAAETALTLSFNAMTGADALTAATELRAIEGQLETLFLTTARFSRLSLATFLR